MALGKPTGSLAWALERPNWRKACQKGEEAQPLFGLGGEVWRWVSGDMGEGSGQTSSLYGDHTSWTRLTQKDGPFLLSPAAVVSFVSERDSPRSHEYLVGRFCHRRELCYTYLSF